MLFTARVSSGNIRPVSLPVIIKSVLKLSSFVIHPRFLFTEHPVKTACPSFPATRPSFPIVNCIMTGPGEDIKQYLPPDVTRTVALCLPFHSPAMESGMFQGMEDSRKFKPISSKGTAAMKIKKELMSLLFMVYYLPAGERVKSGFESENNFFCIITLCSNTVS